MKELTSGSSVSETSAASNVSKEVGASSWVFNQHCGKIGASKDICTICESTLEQHKYICICCYQSAGGVTTSVTEMRPNNAETTPEDEDSILLHVLGPVLHINNTSLAHVLPRILPFAIIPMKRSASQSHYRNCLPKAFTLVHLQSS